MPLTMKLRGERLLRRSFKSCFRKQLAMAALALTGAPAALAQVTYDVTNNLDDGSVGSLRWAMLQANAFSGVTTITFSAPMTVNLTGDLPQLTNRFGTTINGNGATIDGGSNANNNGFRGFFVGVSSDIANAGLLATTTTTFSLNSLTIRNTNARGGHGGSGYLSGGGGAGLGGAIFVNAGTLNVSSVTFENNKAVGGNGGAFFTAGGGGGGGMGGNGGNGAPGGAIQTGGGGGGFGLNATGGSAFAAGPGSFVGSANAGNGGGAAGLFGFGAINGGGGGGGGFSGAQVGSGGGGGGIGGTNGFVNFPGELYSPGGSGGFGGGGGGGGFNFNYPNGAGGYGGGGGGDGDGGFGGGAGGFTGFGTVAQPGFGGGGGALGANSGSLLGNGGGGGGAGLGGAVFVRQGAAINFLDGAFTGNTVVAGLGNVGAIQGNPPANGANGQAIGQAMFLAGAAQYSVSTGNTVTISNSIGGGSHALITGGFTKAGNGSLALASANNYSGVTQVDAGTLRLDVAGAVGTTPVLVGAGSLHVQESQTLTSLGNFSPSAVTMINGADTVLTINQELFTNYSGTVGGTGTLRKAGPTQMSLVGTSANTARL